ncbi:MAG: hypothetical protein QY306_18110 [Anaerolineales bacterium]|nr:MAG: hypothetical protein QY306_18110 [Anaerolineales bacterium]
MNKLRGQFTPRKNQLQPLIALAFLLISTLACNIFGDDGLAEAEEEYLTEQAQTQAAKTATTTPTRIPIPGPTLSVPEGTAGPTKTKDPNAAAQALQAMLVPNGPPDIPGWDGENELELADESHLVFYLPEDWMYEKAPYYYADLMPQYGWEITGDGIVSESNTTTMVFVKENRTATVVISIESDRRVKVTINIVSS